MIELYACKFLAYLRFVVFTHEICHVVFESIIEDAFADFVADFDYEVFIVDAGEGFAGDLVDLIKMVDVGGRVIFTTVAIASGVEGLKHFAILGVADIDAAIWGIERAVAGLAGWSDAVESVAAIQGTNE